MKFELRYPCKGSFKEKIYYDHGNGLIKLWVVDFVELETIDQLIQLIQSEDSEKTALISFNLKTQRWELDLGFTCGDW